MDGTPAEEVQRRKKHLGVRPWKAWILEPVVDEGVHDGHGFGRESEDVGIGIGRGDGEGRGGQNVEKRLGPARTGK